MTEFDCVKCGRPSDQANSLSDRHPPTENPPVNDKPNALTDQVGGNHYRAMAIQPMEFSMANNWDACAHTILKYLARHRQKNGLEDLRKARHCIDLRLQLHEQNEALRTTVSMEDFCRGNNVHPADARILLKLEDWVHSDGAFMAQRLSDCLDALIAEQEDARMDVVIRNGPTGEHYG